MIKITYHGVDEELQEMEGAPSYSAVEKTIKEKSGPGNDFLGWLDYVSKLPEEEIERINQTAKRIRNNYEALVVIGIGGSYLGSRAAIEAIKGLYPQDQFKIYFIGETLSATYTAQLLKKLENVNYAVNVISKSGTTTEPAVAFRLIKEQLKRRLGPEGLKDAIIATTDKARGSLKSEAEAEGYECFVIPDDVGGRYSVITPVGLLPMAVSGLDIKAFIDGVKEAEISYSKSYKNNVAYQYGAHRYHLYRTGHPVEMFISYEPQLQMLNEWLKQLFGESEGKDGKGILPTSIVCTTDLHSMGQFVQDGNKIIFETIIDVLNSNEDLTIPHDEKDLDGLNYLESKKLSYINDMALKGTLEAHEKDGGVPIMKLAIERLDEKHLGELMYFFMRACAFSAYLLAVNPFNQPGVEIYKKNMFRLLGKPQK